MLNWFMVFNDIRAQGDSSAYESESTLPAHHFPELRKWYEYVITKRDMQHYVGPGASYRIRHWAPELKAEVLMGDMVVPSRPAETGDRRSDGGAREPCYLSHGGRRPAGAVDRHSPLLLQRS